jgi:hypothetical protein
VPDSRMCGFMYDAKVIADFDKLRPVHPKVDPS